MHDGGLWTVKPVAADAADYYPVTAYSLLDYFRYYVVDLSVMTLYSAAIFIGFDLYEEAENGVFEHLLGLPLSRACYFLEIPTSVCVEGPTGI
jgi:hypothetical protein